MGSIGELIDPWNLIWVIPAKGMHVVTHALLFLLISLPLEI